MASWPCHLYLTNSSRVKFPFPSIQGNNIEKNVPHIPFWFPISRISRGFGDWGGSLYFQLPNHAQSISKLPVHFGDLGEETPAPMIFSVGCNKLLPLTQQKGTCDWASQQKTRRTFEKQNFDKHWKQSRWTKFANLLKKCKLDHQIETKQWANEKICKSKRYA